MLLFVIRFGILIFRHFAQAIRQPRLLEQTVWHETFA